MFFACRRLRARFENHRKIALNALLARLTAPSRLEKQYFQVSERRNGSRGALEGLLKLLWDPLGRQLRSTGALLGAFGRSWVALGTLLTLFWGALGRSWGALGTLLAALGALLSSKWPPSGLQVPRNGLQVASKWPPSGLQVASKWPSSGLQTQFKCRPSALKVTFQMCRSGRQVACECPPSAFQEDWLTD